MLKKQIEFYAWPTPNGYKISIMLEECGLPYRVIPVDILEGKQFAGSFRKLSPNGKIPVIVDPDGPEGKPLTVFESGAILLYLADRTGRFLSSGPAQRSREIQWLTWQVACFGPMLGQAHHFRQYAREEVRYAINRYTTEARRLYGVLNRQLKWNAYAAGEECSIADFAIFPWALNYKTQGVDEPGIPYVLRWIERMYARPGVRRGFELLKTANARPKELSRRQYRKIFGT